MELKNVKLKAKLEPQSGVGQQSGKDWTKQTVILEETEGKFPKDIAVTAWNTVQADLNKIAIGTEMDCVIRLESREYNGKWYTDVILSGFYLKAAPVKQYAPSTSAPLATSDPKGTYEKETDLPF